MILWRTRTRRRLGAGYSASRGGASMRRASLAMGGSASGGFLSFPRGEILCMCFFFLSLSRSIKLTVYFRKRMPDPPTPSRKTTRRHHHHHRQLDTRGRASAAVATRLVFPSSRVVPPPPAPHTSPLCDAAQFEVDAIFSAHSDGMVVILRRAS